MKTSDFGLLMPNCCSEVLESMYFTSVLGTTESDAIPELSEGSYAYSLNFSGDLHGSFGLEVESAAALSMAANFLGEEESDLTVAEVAEVMGELANMLCGSVMSHAKSERKFVLSHPEPIRSLPQLDPNRILVARLETDYGVVATWVSLGGTACSA